MTFSSQETPHETLNATRARQGRWGRHVFWVLVFGTLLAALGLFAAWTWRTGVEEPPGPGMERVSGQAYDVPTPAAPTPPTQ